MLLAVSQTEEEVGWKSGSLERGDTEGLLPSNILRRKR